MQHVQFAPLNPNEYDVYAGVCTLLTLLSWCGAALLTHNHLYMPQGARGVRMPSGGSIGVGQFHTH